MEYYFNVAHRGRHLFRTDKYNDASHVDEIQKALAARFTAEEGFMIELSYRDASWHGKKVAN